MIVKPPRVRPGDRIAVFAPSFPTAALFPERFNAGVAALERVFGAEVVVPEHVGSVKGNRSAPPKELAAAFTDLATDSSVGAIVATIGGHGAAELLPHLDPEVLREHPTVLVGYSDVTSLLLGLQATSGWCTFHGPTVMTDLAEAPAPDAFTIRSLLAAVTDPAPMGVLTDPISWTAEFLDWGTDDWRRGRSAQGDGSRSTWQRGAGRGRTFGGNLETVVHLTGTPYFRPPDELVLLLETTGNLTTPATVRQALVHLYQAGVLGRAHAVLFGRCPEFTQDTAEVARDTLRELVGPMVPILADLPFGHHSPIWTVPLGVEAAVDVSEDSASVTILEAGVT